MPLKVVKRPDSPFYYVRGSVRGQPCNQSTQTTEYDRAEEFRANLEAKLWNRAVKGERGTHTFSEAVILYLSQRSPGPSYAATVNQLLGYFKHWDVSDINQGAVDKYVRTYYHNRHPATTIRAVITPMTAILRVAAKRGWCDIPAFERPDLPKRKVRFLTEDEAAKVIEKAAPHLKPLFTFLLNTGARLGEALNLNWQEVDLTAKTVRFLDTKNGEARGVPLNDAAWLALANLAHREGIVFRPPGSIEGYYLGKGLGGSPVKTGWKGACRRAGIKKARVHDLRHTFASWLAMKGAPLITIGKLLGHKSMESTMIYAHLSVDHLRTTVNLIGPGIVQDDSAKAKTA